LHNPLEIVIRKNRTSVAPIRESLKRAPSTGTSSSNRGRAQHRARFSLLWSIGAYPLRTVPESSRCKLRNQFH
ncbi:MAG: hypothetical protein WBQ39_21120, partial [Terriglobales bacterium]